MAVLAVLVVAVAVAVAAPTVEQRHGRGGHRGRAWADGAARADGRQSRAAAGGERERIRAEVCGGEGRDESASGRHGSWR